MSLASHPLSAETALGFRRLHTTPGVDVYDQFTWERRDARIHDWRDGSVAFEQPDIEVPSSWSVNASNILAQKYFRGTLGTPERESSLRQVVDRVVDTITGLGARRRLLRRRCRRRHLLGRAEVPHLLATGSV